MIGLLFLFRPKYKPRFPKLDELYRHNFAIYAVNCIWAWAENSKPVGFYGSPFTFTNLFRAQDTTARTKPVGFYGSPFTFTNLFRAQDCSARNKPVGFYGSPFTLTNLFRAQDWAARTKPSISAPEKF